MTEFCFHHIAQYVFECMHDFFRIQLSSDTASWGSACA
jgi:hypothetical protein